MNNYKILVNKENLLPESFVPTNMVEIHEPTGIKIDSNYVNMLDKNVYLEFKLMQQDALKEGYEIFIDSSYRSYDYQKRVYEANALKYGEEYAKVYCAIPGSSEHQTGFAFDVIFRRKGKIIEEFTENDPEIIWCMKNSYKYGFILRYPKGKEDITGYNFEPWHYRYVGREISNYMHDNSIETFEEYHLHIIEKAKTESMKKVR